MDNRYYFEKGVQQAGVLAKTTGRTVKISNTIGDIVEIDKNETQHLVKVRRAKVGDIITGFCGDGYDYELQIENIGKTTTCKLVKIIRNKSFLTTPVTVFLSTLKNDALNESIDNLTQLNVKNIVLFDTKFSVANIDDDKLEKLRVRSIQACKQCERADFVNITSMKYKQVIECLKDYDLVLFAYENTTNPFVSDLKDYIGKNIALIVGCEGGFSAEEAEELNGLAKTISLGKTILRAPVACTALTSAVMSGLGEWGAVSTSK